MRVFFFCSHGFDYVQDLTFYGLNKVLGREKVVDYPWNKKYHLPFWQYPKNLGFSPGLLLAPPARKSLIKQSDVVVVGAVKADVFDSLLACIDEIPSKVPLILIDGGDLDSVGGDLLREGRATLFEEVEARRPFDLVLKREMVEHKNYPSHVIPFPLSFNTDLWRFQGCPKSYRVAFWGVESHPIRTKALRLLRGHFDCDENGTKSNQSFNRYKRKGPQYLSALSQCEIVLSFWGAGYEALRFWEALGVGSFLLTQRPKIRMHHPFVDKTHLVYLEDDVEDLIDKCNYYLENPIEREQIAEAGHAHLIQHHTLTNRVNYLLSNAERLCRS